MTWRCWRWLNETVEDDGDARFVLRSDGMGIVSFCCCSESLGQLWDARRFFRRIACDPFRFLLPTLFSLMGYSSVNTPRLYDLVVSNNALPLAADEMSTYPTSDAYTGSNRKPLL